MVIKKVTDPSKMVTDGLVLRELACQGIDKDYVEFFQDYAPRGQGKECSPYAKFYRDLKSGKKIMVVSGLPMVTATGDKIEVGWLFTKGKYYAKANLFSAVVEGKRVTLTCLGDEPDGRKQGDRITWQPQLFLDGVEQTCGEAVLLETDPTNENYSQNVLEWDYGICQRRLRVIEGRIRERWIFSEDPKGEVRIKHNQEGDYRLKFGQFQINDDEELVPREAFELPNDYFDETEYPLEVGASATYYPDADEESTSVDGGVKHVDDAGLTWAAIRGAAGTAASDSTVETNVRIYSDELTDKWRNLMRTIFLFDTSALPDGAVISAATLSLFGVTGWDNLSITPDINIYSSNPASNIALEAGDFDSLGDTEFATAITYAGWSTTGYNDFTLNASGRAAISKSGVSKFGSRNANYDAANSAPNWSNYTDSLIRHYCAELGSGYKPKLVVTYSTVTEKSSSDAGSGAESLGSRLLGVVETVSALEASLLTAVLTSGDAGLGSEFGGLLKEVFAGDDGGGRDVLRALVKIPTTGSDMRLTASPG